MHLEAVKITAACELDPIIDGQRSFLRVENDRESTLLGRQDRLDRSILSRKGPAIVRVLIQDLSELCRGNRGVWEHLISLLLAGGSK